MQVTQSRNLREQVCRYVAVLMKEIVMSKIAELVTQAVAAVGLGKAAFDRQPGKGALFAYADNDTGVLARIEGVWVTPAPSKFVCRFDGKPHDDGMITLIGTVEGHPKASVEGFLKPHTYIPTAAQRAEKEMGLVRDDEDAPDPSYKKGEITVTGANGKKLTWKVNSKVLISKTSGQPYRFMWFTHDQTRVAF